MAVLLHFVTAIAAHGGYYLMAEKKAILLRLSPRMWEEISKWADDEFRSVNGQIEYLISEALSKRKKTDSNKTHPEDEVTVHDKNE